MCTFFRVPIVLGIAVLINGCASGVAFQNPHVQLPGPDTATVYLMRPKELIGRIVTFPVKLMGEPLLDVAPGTYATFSLRPGSYDITVGDDRSGGRPGMEVSRVSQTFPMSVSAGQTYYVELRSAAPTGGVFSWRVRSMNAEEGRALLNALERGPDPRPGPAK